MHSYTSGASTIVHLYVLLLQHAEAFYILHLEIMSIVTKHIAYFTHYNSHAYTSAL